VVGKTVKGARTVAESMRLVEVDPFQGGTREDVIEMHAKPHETGGRPFA
jgi:hypothetical protein